MYSVNSTYGDTADYISPSRFNVSNDVVVTKQYDAEMIQQQNERKGDNNSVCELNAPDPIREIFTLNDNEREYIIRWHNDYFGKLKIEKLKPDNYFSPPKVTIDEILPSQQGTGSRAILPILIKLLNPKIKILCIDEPELGIEPKTQKRLFDLIKKIARGENELPKKKIVIATHSHIFVDKDDFRNNFKVVKENGEVKFGAITDSIELQNYVFSLLGNDPSDLFFPSNIITVEGKSDEIFLKRIYELLVASGQVEKKKIAFHFCGGYDKADIAVEAVTQMLKTQGYMPIYQSKICGLFDKPSQNKKLVDDIRTFVGDNNQDRFVLLDKEAIEFFYPLDAIRKTLSNETLTKEQVDTEFRKYLQQYKSKGAGTFFTFNDIKKVDLATRVALNMDNLNEIDIRILNIIKKSIELSY
ncbi:MAG: AAA family ATPase [Ignavibacteriaceae bacterium]